MNQSYESILKKIKGLLAIANDEQNDEESQSAFLLAQKLMIKHQISMSEIDTLNNDSPSIDEGQVTAHKKLFWWERSLATIISKNFKVKNFLHSIKKGGGQAKRAIMFMGLEDDVILAKEMYILAYDAIVLYANRYVEQYYTETGKARSRRLTGEVKDSYILGFINGLTKKFDEQLASLKKEYGLMVLVPKEVEEKFEIKLGNAPRLSVSIPNATKSNAYATGYTDGNSIDYTKSTIDE